MKTTRWTLPFSLLVIASACKEADPGDPTSDPTGDSSTGTSADASTTGTPTSESTTDTPTTGEPTTDENPTTTAVDPTTGDPTGDPTTNTTGDPTGDPCDALQISPIDEAACEALATDYQPRVNMSKDDMWAACVTDNGIYKQIDAKVPGSVARVVQYETAAKLLWRDGVVPTKEDFTAARDAYITPEGLESRLVRREDLHYPAIPMNEWDPQVDSDKQCTVEALYMKYPDRCVGPAKIQPIVDAAFAAGMTGDGDANVHAAVIDAALQWFLWVSIYKESASCILAPGDCDSSWAYYNGATAQGEAIGVAANLVAIDPAIDEAIFNGMLAIRCWRDLYPADGDPAFEDLGPNGEAMFYSAHEQLDNAAWYGWARLVREHLELQPAVCDSEADANWAFIQVAGPVLDPEAETRDGTAAGTLAALWANDAPTVEDLEAGIAAIDAAFPCPQCETCDVPAAWGY